MNDYQKRIRAAIHAPSDSYTHAPSDLTSDLTLAAVLMPIITYDRDPHILLTQRAAHLGQHSGQVAFPGGKVEAQDTTPIATALREAQEEVGLESQYVDIVGVLDALETGTGFRILPVVGFVRPGFTLRADANEVADIFEVPLQLALSEKNYQARSGVWQGRTRHYHAMEYQGFNIWGATAGMLLNLGRRL